MSDETQLQALKDWLASYHVGDLIKDGKPVDQILSIMPKDDSKKLGQVKATYDPYKALDLPGWKECTVEKGSEQSCMQITGSFLDKVFQANPSSIRLFSPDELESNKLNAILNHTQRNFQWDQFSTGSGGRVIEVLSEHDCQAFMQGYTLTGRAAIFPSYESFLGIVHTMMVQYSKFVKIAKEVKWRGPLASINYIETSTWARQEHNGFSHQNPSFIGAVLNLKPDMARVYLPPDANCFLSTVHHCLRSKNYVNLVIGSKQPTAVYLSPEEAEEHCRQGASIWHFASTPDADGSAKSTPDPDVVLVGIGVEVTFEVVKAAELLRTMCPALKVRVVNVTDLMIVAAESSHPHALGDDKFNELFTADRPVLFNYHGYATELSGLLFGRKSVGRMSVEGYREEGTTTTPFDMMLVNCVSRFDLVERALKAGARRNEEVKGMLEEGLKEVKERVKAVREFIVGNGKGKFFSSVECLSQQWVLTFLADPDDIYELAKF
jgi:xylulose-5-phosphate/fructose-6-phosphate phosphoketolase